MDAKPHRPFRAVRVRNDENMPPDAAVPGKTIHHRNKSSPALCVMAGGAALSKTAATKRTAFGDVSNIAALPAPSKDDSALPAKAAGGPVVGLRAAAPAPLTKPAQRPLSVSGLKSLLTGNNNNHHLYYNTSSSHNSVKAKADQAHKLQVCETAQQPANGNTAAARRSVLSKRATSIFKDADAGLNSVPETEVAQLQLQPQRQRQLSRAVPSNVSLPPLPAAASASASAAAAANGHATTNTSSFEQAQHTSASDRHASAAGFPDTSLAGIEAPAKKQDAAVASTVTTNQAQPPPLAPTLHYLAQPDFAVDQIVRMPVLAPLLPAALHPQHIYQAQAPADTTTGATTLLFPKASQRARQELSDAKQLVDASRTVEEIEDETFDTSMVTEYGDDIFAYMKELEISMLPNAHYMDNQHEIQWSMRSVLMDWLVQVHHRFGLLPETLFLCVNYIDRFLSCKVVSLGKLQLVGATAIFIAAKYEEINCPSVQEIVYMVDNGYTVDEILKAERFMLTMLQFELGFPGPMSFLRRISKADDYDLETRTLAKYFLEITIMDERFLASPPSFAAAASHCLARMLLRKGSWTPHHVHYSGYTFAQLRPLVRLLLECCENARKHHAAVFNKYGDKRYKRASAFVQAELQRGFRLPTHLHQAKPYTGPQLQQFFDSVSYFHT
ncbi:hypothetical protein DV737_g553, partial [Chaetothyriales sp. CBS 132003]